MDLTHVVLLVDNTPRYEYTGFYNHFWQRHGNGTSKFLNGQVYAGNFENGKRHGDGVYTFPNGCYYKGQWKDNVREGKGMFINSDGSFYEGEWLDDKACGYGSFYYSNGDYYEGMWSENIRDGRGKYEYSAAQLVWVGNFLRGRRVGTGAVYKSGTEPQNWMEMDMVQSITDLNESCFSDTCVASFPAEYQYHNYHSASPFQDELIKLLMEGNDRLTFEEIQLHMLPEQYKYHNFHSESPFMQKITDDDLSLDNDNSSLEVNQDDYVPPSTASLKEYNKSDHEIFEKANSNLFSESLGMSSINILI